MSISEELIDLMRQLHPGAPEERARALRWRPAADIYRSPGGWVVKMELAGVRNEDIDVSVSGHRLTVRGRRADTALVEGCEFYSLEIAYDRFERSLELPERIEEARVITEYHNGMLLVRLMSRGGGP